MQSPGNQAQSHPRLYASWDDSALVQALRRGDVQAFAEIYHRYGFLLLEQAFRKINSREVAEEIVQDLFAALWHKRETADIQKLREYLGSAVKYRVINLIKNKLTHSGYVAYRRTVAEEADRRTEEEIAAADLSSALNVGLAHLPGHTREIFQLSRLEHQTVPQIAVRLKLSPKAVEYHITRALRLLRVSLKDFLVPLILLLLQ
ncbi:sigma-70 family RNA polymerase sigma factor [Hymenobacter terricola]|uniref:sigma-70 family RNA polymerase sigma factor n=1 Tax=Hymenobacter terricola TaxID=2819236 RepID=UPI001B30996C|nr:sigma-70 family RNA polymerase sigma factor [Hymenobacter terricola]